MNSYVNYTPISWISGLSPVLENLRLHAFFTCVVDRTQVESVRRPSRALFSCAHDARYVAYTQNTVNTALKFFFATQMQAVSEAHGLSDEQWGSRKNRSLIDAGLVHLLAFECGRAKHSTVAEISHDLKACFDRMQVG